jgi:hypothetical protein
MFCKYQLCPFDLLYILDLGFLYEFFCLDDLSMDDNGELKSPMTTVLELIHAFGSFRICLMKLGVLTLGTYRFRTVISVLSVCMECPSLSPLINVGLKSTLSEISSTTPAVFGGHGLDKSSSSLSS